VLSINILDSFAAPYLTYMAGVASMADAWFTHCLYILTCAAIYLALPPVSRPILQQNAHNHNSRVSYTIPAGSFLFRDCV